MTLEIPACAAIRLLNDSLRYIIIAGKRHHDCIASRAKAWPDFHVSCEQGFMTNRGRFVGRKEAMALMLAAGIPSANKGGEDQSISPPGFRGDELYSEDLY